MRTIIALVIVIYMLLAVPAVAQTGYTSRSAFDTATTNYAKTFVTFDSQAAGTSADSYGIMTIYATGLDSTGGAWYDLPRIATNAFPTTSGANALGVSGADHSFLAGNSDTISFLFSAPVSAFGMYLIGDPSPTGTPAIPFWEMVAGSSAVFSDTVPAYSLGAGSDVYFIGITSPGAPFTQVNLYSYNDPAAVFSFNVDDVIYATLPDAMTIPQAKGVASGQVLVTDAVVERVHSDRFNVESASLRSGLAVMGGGATQGTAVTLLGNMGVTSDDERVLNLTQILSQAPGWPPGPCRMTTRSLGGSGSVGLQNAIPGGWGANNVGLDVGLSGKITGIAADFSWMTVDDDSGRQSGYGFPGVAVVGATNARGRYVGQYVMIRGSSSVVRIAGVDYPLVRVAASGDISP